MEFYHLVRRHPWTRAGRATFFFMQFISSSDASRRDCLCGVRADHGARAKVRDFSIKRWYFSIFLRVEESTYVYVSHMS